MYGACPKCGATVETPDGFSAIYTAVTEDGGRVSGGLYMTVCLACGEKLEAEKSDPDEPPKWLPEWKPPENT